MNPYVIAIEGEKTVDGRLIRPGALTWETPIPVFGVRAEDEWSSPIVGTVEDIERIIGEGARSELRARISWFDDPLPLKGQGLCASVDAVEQDYETTYGARSLILKGGRIRALFLGEPAWPDTVIGGEA